MSAGLEFHWPGRAHDDYRRPSPELDPTPSVMDADAPSDLDVAGGHSAECKRVLRQALDRIVELEDALRETRQQLADAQGAVDVQRVHIDSLNTKVRSRRSKRAGPKR